VGYLHVFWWQLVAPFAPGQSLPPWERANFVPSEQTRAAFELAHDAEQFELRAREGLGVSVRFPASRTSLWNADPQGLPVHVTFDACLPSICMPPSVIESLRSCLSEAEDQRQLEFVGHVTSVDHQLAYADSMTRGRLQVVFDMLRSKRVGNGPNGSGSWELGDGDSCIALLLRDKNAADAEMLSADEKQADVTALSGILKERRHLASALDYVKFSLLCAKANGHTITLQCQASVPCVTFMLTPLRLLKVIPTTLSQTLYERVSADAAPATGFLSMDQARRLLLIPQLDPKARQVPLVGVWVSGVDSIADAIVWASLARFLHCAEIGEKVTCHDGAFLCLFYHRTALRQPPVLLQVSVHSGHSMFAHAGTRPVAVQLGSETAVDKTEKADVMLEFDQKRVQYSHTPGYDVVKETLSHEHKANDASVDLPRSAVPQPSPPPPAAPQSFNEGSELSAYSHSVNTSAHSMILSHATPVYNASTPHDVRGANDGMGRRLLESKEGADMKESKDSGDFSHPPEGGGGGANFMMAATVRNVKIPDQARPGDLGYVRGHEMTGCGFDGGGEKAGRGAGGARRRLDTYDDTSGGQGGDHDCQRRIKGGGVDERKEGSLMQQIEAQQRQIFELTSLVQNLQVLLPPSPPSPPLSCLAISGVFTRIFQRANSNNSAWSSSLQKQISTKDSGACSPTRPTCATGTQIDTAVNKSIFASGHATTTTTSVFTDINSAPSARIKPTAVPSHSEAELLLPTSPAEVGDKGTSGVDRWSDANLESARLSCSASQEADGRQARHGQEKEMCVFKDTLGVHPDTWHGSVSEVLRSTFPQPRHPLVALPAVNPASILQPGEERGRDSAAKSPKKEGSPYKAPKARNADQAVADPGVSASEACLVEPRQGTGDVATPIKPISTARTSDTNTSARERPTSSPGGREQDGCDGEHMNSIHDDSKTEIREWKRGNADYGGLVSIDYVNSSIVRANIGKAHTHTHTHTHTHIHTHTRAGSTARSSSAFSIQMF
jgi:hypothetical protein